MWYVSGVEESVGANSREDIAEALEQAAILMTRHLTARAALSLTAALEPGDRTTGQNSVPRGGQISRAVDTRHWARN